MPDLNEPSEDHHVFILPKYIKVTERIIFLLDRLLEFAPPEELRRDVTHIYLNYIVNQHEALPLNFDKTSENMLVFHDFLVQVEDELKSADNS